MNKVLGFLETLWGKVAAATAMLPGIAAIFDAQIALENSPLKALYPSLGTAISSFVILLLVARTAWFVRWKITVSIAIMSMLLGAVLLVFMLFGKSMMDCREEQTFPANSTQAMLIMPQIYTMPGVRSFLQNNPDQKGEVRTIWDRGRGINELIVNGQVQMHLEYTNILPEVLLLSSFVLSMAFFTAAFTVLGVHAYVTSLNP